MATFSQGFLQSLASPSYARNLYDIGRQIGQAPTAVAQMNKEDQFREIMKLGNAAIANNDAAGLARVASQLNNLGYTEEAVKFSTAARKATAETKKAAKTAAEEEEVRKRRASLMGAANMKAAQSSNPAKEIAMVRGMDDEQLLEYLSDDKKTEGTISKGTEITVEDSKGNLYTRVIQYNNKTGKREASIEPFPNSPKDPVGELKIVSGTTGLSGFDAPTIAGQRTEEVEYNKLRVEAVASLSGIENSIEDAQASLSLLDQIQTGGFGTSVVRKAQKVLGVTPENEADFNFLAAQEVLNGLQFFTGAISEGEREFLMQIYQSLEKSGFANRAILNRLVKRYERALKDAQLRANSSNLSEYLSNRAKKDTKDDKAPEETSTDDIVDFNDFSPS